MSILSKILATKFWEPEEAVGTLWDGYADRMDAEPHHPLAAVSLMDMKARLGVLFRGLGGEGGVEIKACGETFPITAAPGAGVLRAPRKRSRRRASTARSCSCR